MNRRCLSDLQMICERVPKPNVRNDEWAHFNPGAHISRFLSERTRSIDRFARLDGADPTTGGREAATLQ